ncbi:MAG: hypothetical protein ACTHN5_04065 [Phycisphaerae bacterium]
MTTAQNPEQLALREKYLLALLAVTQPIYEGANDRKLTLDLLIEAAGMLRSRLEGEREELRIEDD